MKTFKQQYSEVKKHTASSLVKLFKNTDDWGDDMKNFVRVVDGNFEVVSTWYYGEEQAMKNLIKTWTDPKGADAKFFKATYGITFTLVDKFSQVKAAGRYKKITKDGIVGIILKIT